MSRSVPFEASRARIIKEKLPVFAYFPAENRRSRAFVADVCGKNSKKLHFLLFFVRDPPRVASVIMPHE